MSFIGGNIPRGTDPSIRILLDKIISELQSLGFGDVFRFREGPYPDRNSQNTFQLQQRNGTAWRTIQTFPVAGVQELTASAYMTTSSATAAFGNAVWSNFDFDGILFDASSCITVGTSWVFTVPAGKAGRYLVSGSVQSSTSTQFDSKIGIFLNPGFSSPPTINTWSQMFEIRDSASPSANLSRTYSVLLNCAAGDTIAVGGQAGGVGYTAVKSSTTTRYSFINIIKIL